MSDHLNGFGLLHPGESEVYCIAYGSNLDEARMKKRCPTAEPFGTSVIHGYRLLFNAITYELLLPDCEDEEMAICIWKTGHVDSGSMRSICDCLAAR